MAAESLLPLFHETSAAHMAADGRGPSEEDDLLAELLGGAGDDLLTSLLEPSSVYLGQLSPAVSSPPPSSLQPLSSSISHTLLASDIMANSSLPSPTHDGCISDGSSLNRAHSPSSYTSYSPVDMLANSPANGDVMVTSTSSIPADELDALLGSFTNVSSGGTSSEVKINVDSGLTMRGVHAEAESWSSQAVCGEASPTDSWASQAVSCRKAATLVLTEEEKQLLAAEGVSLPTDMPLTKQEQKHLKRVQRKIKNKLSAQESRKRKKEYVEGLEERVQCCTATNNRLRQRVDSLETENKSLLQQLQQLRSMVARIHPTKLQAGTLVMVLSLSFSLLVFPWPRPPGPTPSSHSVIGELL
jgi:hypothetical protein